MSSWRDAASRYDKEQADEQKRKADEQARRERVHAANLEAVAKADRLVQDFLRSAKSVGNPGAKHDTYEEVGWLFKKRIPKGVAYWYGGYYPSGQLRGHLKVQVNGLWKHGHYDRGGGWDGAEPRGFEMGRNTEGLYCKSADGSTFGFYYISTDRSDVGRIGASKIASEIASETDALQRDLVELMRKHGIPLPS